MHAVLMVFAALSCSKPDNTDTDVAPTNLTLTANVSTDSSGVVSFVASATNAIAYSFDYGNNTTEVSASGVFVYICLFLSKRDGDRIQLLSRRQGAGVDGLILRAVGIRGGDPLDKDDRHQVTEGVLAPGAHGTVRAVDQSPTEGD